MSGRNDPEVTFIVPCYNYARYLGDCLQSIFSQEAEQSFEVLAIDDASSDDTQEVLRQFSNSRLRVITHESNVGHVATISEGLHLARGRFIARIDPDDRYRPYFLATVMEAFATYPQCGVVYGDAALIDEHGQMMAPSSDRAHRGQNFVGNELVALLHENFICAPTVVARRDAWLGALPVPRGLAFNDWYFTLMMARTYDFCYLNTVLAEYRIHAMNHHATVVRNGSEEPSIFWLLNRVFSQAELDPERDRGKRKARRSVYATQYLTLADKYFGFHMDRDARRCYLQAFRYRPRYLLRPDVLRHAGGVVVGRKRYDLCKSLVTAAANTVRGS